ncbi:hypothetical protein [Phaeobacter sp. S60]|uniref:hypothetical protein n=1 Tax=Phaeobacter sp. S60 TaxID=1569353 RepID=UPI00059108DA|nr:hypothetical protein [Phaeobacter sp. S60]KII11263.1 hypothetical protein OO25_21785 [Phaeobacter sp. S60]
MAQLDTRLPLMSQQPDIVNALARSSAAAQQTNQVQSQNALRNLFQTQGADIAAGQPQALNALAQLDPMQAVQMQSAQQNMQSRAQMMEQRRIAMGREAEAYVASLGAQERAAEAARVEQGIAQGMQFYQRGDLNGLNQLLGTVGEEPLQSLDEFPTVAAMYGDVLDKLKSVQELNAPPKPADEYGRYAAEERAAGRQPLDRIQYAQAKKGQGFSVTTADGTTVQYGGGQSGGDMPDLNVDEGINSGFLIRVKDAGRTLDELEQQGLEFLQQNADAIPLGLGNYMRTEEFQRFDQARRDFINAILRRESGAVISPQEFENAEIQYFPVPGDSPQVIEQKRRNRANAIEGIRLGSGPGAAYVDRMDQQGAAPQQPEPQSGGLQAPQPGVTEDGYRFKGGDPGNPENWVKVE